MILTSIFQSKIPIGRLGKPNEMADIVLLLASNGYMTNKVCLQVSGGRLLLVDCLRQVIVADGGWTIGGF